MTVINQIFFTNCPTFEKCFGIGIRPFFYLFSPIKNHHICFWILFCALTIAFTKRRKSDRYSIILKKFFNSFFNGAFIRHNLLLFGSSYQ